jgi:hypothetical protein
VASSSWPPNSTRGLLNSSRTLGRGEEEGAPLEPEEEEAIQNIITEVAACMTPLTHMAAGVNAAATWITGPGPIDSAAVNIFIGCRKKIKKRYNQKNLKQVIGSYLRHKAHILDTLFS